MKSDHPKLICQLVFLLACMGVVQSVHSQDGAQGSTSVGRISTLQGSASVTRNQQAAVTITLSETVFRLDVLETAPDSLLEVTLADGSLFSLDESSVAAIAEYVTDAQPQGLLSLTRGRLRARVGTIFSSRSQSFKVQTSQGVIGVQGTEFDVIAMARETELFVWDGVVIVTHVDPQFPDVQTVQAGETVRWAIDEAIPPPRKIDSIPEAQLPPPMFVQDNRLPPLVPGSRVSWASECNILSRPVPSDALEPVLVGAQDDVGKQGLIEKQAKNVLGNLLSRVLGGSSSSSSSKGPRTRRDPSRREDYLELNNEALETELGVRGKWTEDGLLISSRIEESPDKGTFQSVFLEDCSGHRLEPSQLELYKTWSKATLTVSWTKTTYMDGSVIDRESGGFSHTWNSEIDRYSSKDEPTSGSAPVWQQAGYDRAHAGVRQIGAYFKITPKELEQLGELAFVAHLTRPGQDPITTTAFAVSVKPGDEKVPLIRPLASP